MQKSFGKDSRKSLSSFIRLLVLYRSENLKEKFKLKLFMKWRVDLHLYSNGFQLNIGKMSRRHYVIRYKNLNNSNAISTAFKVGDFSI